MAGGGCKEGTETHQGTRLQLRSRLLVQAMQNLGATRVVLRESPGMRRLFSTLMLTLALGIGVYTYGPIAITNNHGKLEMFILVPEDAVGIAVAVYCDHHYATSSRAVRFRQEAFTFRDLHDDAYDIEVVFKHRDGRQTRIVSHANVSR